MTSPVQVMDNFLSEEQCTHIIDTYKIHLIPSRVVHNGIHSEEHPSRTSSTFYLPSTDPVIAAIREKVAEFLNISIVQIESLQLLRYRKGERYLYHHDYLSGNPANQRVHTIITYLNDMTEEDGGATRFFHYNMAVIPKQGRGVWFRNMDEAGNLIHESLHAGEEIKTDAIKYAINIWTRQSRW